MKYKRLILFSLCLTILFLSIGAISATSNTTDNQNIHQTNNTVTQQTSTNLNTVNDTQVTNTKKEVNTNKSLKGSSTRKSTKTTATYGNTYTSGTVINVKVTSEDSTTPSGNVEVRSNGELYSTQTLSNGQATFNITRLPAGTQEITVKYIGNSKYQTSNVTSTKKITLTSTKTVVTYGNTYTSDTVINVKVTSEDSTTPSGDVRVYYNNELYSTQTLNKGQTIFKITRLPAGTQKITVKYMGNSKYQSSNVTNIKKISVLSTKTTVTYGNTYTFGTVINVKVTSEDNSTPSGNVEVRSNGELYSTQSLNKGQITFKITGLPAGTQKITVKYIGNKKYQSSNITSVKKITLILTKTTATYGNTYTSGTKINVKVTSEDNTTPSGNVEVYYNNKVYSTQSLSNGQTIFNIVGLPAGTGQIVVKYMGSSRYQTSNMTSTKKISSISTKTTVTYGNLYTSGTKINVKVTSADNTIPSGNVKVYYNNKVYSTQSLSNGQTTFNIVGLPAGSRQITVKYMGNIKYQTSNVTSTKKITLTPTKITVEYDLLNTKDTYIFVDVKSKDNTTPYGNVKLYCDNKIIQTDHLYSDPLPGSAHIALSPKLSPGKHNFTVKYMGSSKYAQVNASSIKTVILAPTEITTEDWGSCIHVKVTYDGLYSANGLVKLYSNGKLYATRTLSNGETSFQYLGDLPTSGKYTIKYMGSSVYKASSITLTSPYKTTTFTNFKLNKYNEASFSKMLNSHDKLLVSYFKDYCGLGGKDYLVYIQGDRTDGVVFEYARLVSARVYYKQGGHYYSKSIPLYYTGTYDPDGYIGLSNNQVPYKVTVTYLPYYFG